MKNLLRITSLLGTLIYLLLSTTALAGSPLFTFTPLTATTIHLYTNNTAIVEYRVQNQSSKPHALVMTPTTGITQVTSAGNCGNPFVLGMNQSCTLTLSISGSQLLNNIHSGPVVCQAGPGGAPNPLLCYQPSAANSLNVTVAPVPQYVVTSSAGANGTLSPLGAQVVSNQSSLLFTAIPNANYVVYQWLVDGAVAQTGGTAFLLSDITANHTVQVTFSSSIFYSGGNNGSLYYSFNGGLNWFATVQTPAGGSPIYNVFATVNTVYTGTADGFIHYSTNNGITWNTTSSPDGSAVNSVFFVNDTLYAGTANGSVYISTNNGSTWTATSSPDGSSVNSIFVTTGAVVYAGTVNGNVYFSQDNGATWTPINGQPDGSAVNSIFINNNLIYVGTANEFAYSSTAINGGGSWTPFAQTVYSLFVNSSNNAVYAGTQGGYAYSVTSSAALGFIDYTPINSIYLLGSP